MPTLHNLTDAELRQAHLDATRAFCDNQRRTPLPPDRQAAEAAREARIARTASAWRDPPTYVVADTRPPSPPIASTRHLATDDAEAAWEAIGKQRREAWRTPV